MASITDCDHHCARCGEHLSSCSLCVGMAPAVVRSRPLFSRSEEIEAERELDRQSRAIGLAAEDRWHEQ